MDPRYEAVNYAYKPHHTPLVRSIILMFAISTGTGDGSGLCVPDNLISRIAQSHVFSLHGDPADHEQQVRNLIQTHIADRLGIHCWWDSPPTVPSSPDRPRRITIPKRLREIVMARDHYTCQWCGANDVSALSIDHIVPVVLGGSNEPDNLRVLCKPCNSSKGAN